MRRVLGAIALILSLTPAALAQQATVDPARVDAVFRAGFPSFPGPAEVWEPRLTPDETMRQCSAADNSPPKATADAIRQRERATIQYPPDGKLIGDWKKGEALAQSGFGLRFTDYPPGNRANGGNCYACHQLTKQEVSYGTIGPSLFAYGRLRDFTEAAAREVYDKIYNPHATLACSLMPRLGANKVLTIEQIKDAVALLMSPDSPVNK